MSYEIRLDIFKGPIDLLLQLIQRDKIDICDIPITYILNEFLKGLEQLSDLEGAGQFIEMAALLMRIKARMLLPRRSTEDELEIGDPRDELVRRLLEYKIYKEIANILTERSQYQENFFPHPTEPIKQEKPKLKVKLYDLLIAMERVLNSNNEEIFYQLNPLEITLEEQINFLKNLFTERNTIYFDELLTDNRQHLIITFIDLLELIRLKHISIHQSQSYGRIYLKKRISVVST